MAKETPQLRRLLIWRFEEPLCEIEGSQWYRYVTYNNDYFDRGKHRFRKDDASVTYQTETERIYWERKTGGLRGRAGGRMGGYPR